MVRSTKKARQVVLEKKGEKREERAMQLHDFIEKRPGETAYSLAKKLSLPLGTVQSLLVDLQNENLIKIIQVVEKGRTKKKVYITGLEDHDFIDYHEHELNDPLIQKLIEKTRNKGLTVFIHRKDGSRIEVKPEQVLNVK